MIKNLSFCGFCKLRKDIFAVNIQPQQQEKRKFGWMKSFKYGKNVNLKERPKKSEKGGCVL